VAFGTSLPELIVSINARLHGSTGIAVGNVIGSNIANILLIIGCTAIVSPLAVVSKAVRWDLAMMMAATAALFVLLLTGGIGRVSGTLMIAALVLYTALQYRMALKNMIAGQPVEEPEFKSMQRAIFYVLSGLALIAVGSEFLVRGAVVCATIVGVPEDVIGLSLIALGTSLPELSTCLVAAAKRQTDIVLGNIIGSNVFNILMILGITSLVGPIASSQVAPQLLKVDIWVFLGVSLLFTAALLFFRKVGRWTGFLFAGGYAAYIIAMYAMHIQ
jgi:cation:H+ antiporter